MRAQVSDVISPTKITRELNLMFRLLVPPIIIILLVIARISIPIPTLMIISSLFLVSSRLLVTFLVQ